mmetsp:Transcript_8175/g.20113  ORF Transcript_8175/g.20113 Transcript_8175/m.20113 type:complete len:133 (+) Transcript_8175:1588-1986(+)
MSRAEAVASRSSSVANVAMLRLSSVVVAVDRSVESQLLLELVSQFIALVLTTGVTTPRNFGFVASAVCCLIMAAAVLPATLGGVYETGEFTTPPGERDADPCPSGRCGIVICYVCIVVVYCYRDFFLCYPIG